MGIMLFVFWVVKWKYVVERSLFYLKLNWIFNFLFLNFVKQIILVLNLLRQNANVLFAFTLILIISMRKYFCTECDLSFDYPSLMERHMRIHTKLKALKCNLCPKTFIRADTLKTHKNIHQNNGYKCCGKTLHSRASLKYHLKTFHVLKCPQCGIVVSNVLALSNHIIVHQPSENNQTKIQVQSTNSCQVQMKEEVKFE